MPGPRSVRSKNATDMSESPNTIQNPNAAPREMSAARTSKNDGLKRLLMKIQLKAPQLNPIPSSAPGALV